MKRFWTRRSGFCIIACISIVKSMQAWSEMVGGMTEVIVVTRPFVITKSSVCPFLWVGPVTC